MAKKAKKEVDPAEEEKKVRGKGPLADPHVLFLVLDKLVNTKRNKVALADRDQYNAELTPGEHRIRGTLDVDVAFTVGENSTAARSYGVPLDSIILLSFLYAGALREHLFRAALVVREIRTAEMEERRVKAVNYRYTDTNGDKRIRIPATQVAAEAARLGLKLIGQWPQAANPAQEEAQAALAEQLQTLLASIKVNRPYDGPVNIVDATLVPSAVLDGPALAENAA
jgi:hypothetical protein